MDANQEARANDVAIGQQIRRARMLSGRRLHDIAAAIGISYQQLQKYEEGSSRVSAGRLQVIASHLGIDLSFFFEGGPGAGQPVPPRDQVLLETMHRLQTATPGLRSAVLNLLKVL